MRTTAEELTKIGGIIAGKLNAAKSPTVMMLPLKGVSAIATEGGPFYDAEADKALFDTIRGTLAPNVELVEMDNAINDEAFALAAAKKLIALLGDA